ncbi:two-component sensor histidine kinase, partial [Escherichia coli]|nr:two-component sensor histidine kinase [Escherichia coli]
IEQTEEIEDLSRDVDEMSRMLEGYLAFARGDSAEPATPTDMRALLEDLRTDVERLGAHVSAVDLVGAPEVTVRPGAFRRCLFNLAANAVRYGETVAISGRLEARAFLVSIDDD